VSADDPDTMLIRFLKSRKWDICAAFVNLIECLRWRKNFGVRDLLASGEKGLHQPSLKSGKLFLMNRDNHGRTVLHIRARLHNKNDQPAEDVMRYFVYMTEIGRRCGSEQATVVFDLSGSGMSSLDLTLAKMVVTTFQEIYPEGLGQWIIIGASWFFRSFWSVLRCIMDPEVSAKVAFLAGPEELTQYIPPHALPAEYGGSGQVPVSSVCEEGPQAFGVDLSPAELEGLAKDRLMLLEQFQKLTIEIETSCAKRGLDTHDPLINAILAHRSGIKRDLMRLTIRMEMATIRPSALHKLGIIAPDGSVSWP